MSSEIARAVAVLRSGGLVGLPTETVYGLAADASNELAVRRIFAVKGRPSSHPLIVHVPNESAAREWTRAFPLEAQQLAAALWPGPLTLVLPRAKRALDAVTGGQDTVALRVPAHPLALELLRDFGGGVAAPSANRFGAVSPTTAEHVRKDLGSDVELVLDGGACSVGVESTIVDLSSGAPAILRPGGAPRERIEQLLGREVPVRTSGSVRAPGMLASHYAPHAGVELLAQTEVHSRVEQLLGAGRQIAVMSAERPDLEVPWLAVPRDEAGFAHELYARLREVDSRQLDVVLIVPPSQSGLGLAVRDRLQRAAAPRGKP